jgi:hypothetical protein
MNMMSSAEDVAYFRPENLEPDLRRLIGLSKDFDCIGPLPAFRSITCSFRTLVDWVGEGDPEQALRRERSLLEAGMTPRVISVMTVRFTRCDDPRPELSNGLFPSR